MSSLLRLGVRKESRRPTSALAALLGCVLLTALTVPLARADDGDDLDQEQQQVEKKKQDASAAAEESSAALTKATTALSSAQKKLDIARTHLKVASTRLARARTAHRRVQTELVEQRGVLAAAKTDLTTARARVKEQREEARDTILRTYETGSPQLQEIAGLLRGATLEELVRRGDYTRAVTSSQAHQLRRLQAGERLVAKREHGERVATKAVAAKEQQAQQQVTAVRKLRTEAARTRDQVARLVSTTRTAKAAAEKQAAADRKVLAALKKQDAALKEKIAGLTAGAVNRTLATVDGMLALPVKNTYITQDYGPRVNPVTGESEIHDGLDLHAPCGTPELAAASGEVIDEVWNDAYGNRLFLFIGKVNGHSYTLVYNHIDTYKTAVGDKVASGDTLSLAGTTGWSTACHLHFMVLEDGTSVDPRPFLPPLTEG